MSNLNLATLPNDTKIEIFIFCDSQDLPALKCVCKSFLELTKNKKITDRLCIFITNPTNELSITAFKHKPVWLKQNGTIYIFKEEKKNCLEHFKPGINLRLENNESKSTCLPFAETFEDFSYLDDAKFGDVDPAKDQYVIKKFEEKKFKFQDLISLKISGNSIFFHVTRKNLTEKTVDRFLENGLIEFLMKSQMNAQWGEDRLDIISQEDLIDLGEIIKTSPDLDHKYLLWSLVASKVVSRNVPHISLILNKYKTHYFQSMDMNHIKSTVDFIFNYKQLNKEEISFLDQSLFWGYKPSITTLKQSCNPKNPLIIEKILPEPLKAQYQNMFSANQENQSLISFVFCIADKLTDFEIDTSENIKNITDIMNIVYKSLNSDKIKIAQNAFKLKKGAELFNRSNLNDLCFSFSSNLHNLELENYIEYKKDIYSWKPKKLDVKFYPENTRKILTLLEDFFNDTSDLPDLSHHGVYASLIPTMIISQTTKMSLTETTTFLTKKYPEFNEMDDNKINYEDENLIFCILALQCLKGEIEDIKDLEKAADSLLEDIREIREIDRLKQNKENEEGA